MITETIDREAGDSAKGFRLQLIRAIKLMLNTVQVDNNAIFFTAVENLEDVSHQIITDGKVINYFEEDKNYDLNGNFTIFSPPVINTLVSFFDIYTDQFRKSNNVHLGFYSTRSIGKERKTKLDNGQEITLPELPILEILNDSGPVPENVLIMLKDILLIEYESQYKDKSMKGHLETLNQMPLSDFRFFLSKITWNFGQEDESDLKQTVLKNIEDSPLHNNSHIGKENAIFCLLMEKLGEKQNSTNLVDKLVHSSDVKLIFKEAESIIPDKNIDPVWKYISQLEEEVTDKRNLKEKMLSVINDLSDHKIRMLARRATGSKYEEIEADKTFLSLKYRIFDACEKYFSSIDYKAPKNISEFDEVLNKLIFKAAEDISKLQKDYKYTVSNEITIEGIILNLFDGCFLALEESSHE